MTTVTIDLCKSCKNLDILKEDITLYYLKCKVKGVMFIMEKELFQCDSFKSNLTNKSGIIKKIFG